MLCGRLSIVVLYSGFPYCLEKEAGSDSQPWFKFFAWFAPETWLHTVCEAFPNVILLLSRVVTNNAQNNTPRPKNNDPMKTRGEILIGSLPPIQDLQINVPAEECMELGKVSSIVDQLGMWESLFSYLLYWL